MRQRLGIGTALLGDPRVLILDEPANGLDPAGIRWMRDLLTGFASQGGTVLLSSHLLHEIEVIADDLVVIGNGKIVASGSKEELLAAAGTLARSPSPRDLAHALEQAGIPSTLAGDGSVRTDADPARVGTVALTAGIALTELRSAEGAGLEDMFLSLTADTQRKGVAARPPRSPPRPPPWRPRPPAEPPVPSRPPGSPRSSCARCSTPARDSGCSSASASCRPSRPGRSSSSASTATSPTRTS